jgi:hypothetical protein
MLNPPYPELDDLLHMMGEAGEGLSSEEIRAICRTFNVKQDII